MTNLEKVVAVQDNEGHWYVIPNISIVVFRSLLEENERLDEFEAAFGKYRTGGDLNLIQLYAEI